MKWRREDGGSGVDFLLINFFVSNILYLTNLISDPSLRLFLSFSLSLFLSLSLSLSLSITLSLYLTLTVSLSLSLSLCLYLPLSVSLSFSLFLYLSLTVYLSLSLPLYLFFSLLLSLCSLFKRREWKKINFFHILWSSVFACLYRFWVKVYYSFLLLPDMLHFIQ